MRKKPVPFYAEMTKGKNAFTLFIDPETKEVYRANHKSINQIFYWIAFVLILALLRAAKAIPITFEHPVTLFAFTLVTIVIGMGIGISFYKGTIGELRHLDISIESIKDYMQDGKKHYRNELLMAALLFAISIIFTVLFLIYLSLIWLIVSFSFFLILGCIIGNISLIRYQILFRNKLEFDKN